MIRKRGEEFADGKQLEGRYANYVEIGHNSYEFLIDFGQSYLGNEDAFFHTRIIVAPAYAKNFYGDIKRKYKKIRRNLWEYQHGIGCRLNIAVMNYPYSRDICRTPQFTFS